MSGVVALQSALLARVAGVRHGFFTRRGGVSRGVYESLNVGAGSRDEPTDVAENRRRAADWFGAPLEALRTCYQVHSAEVVLAERSRGSEQPRGDGVVSSRADIVCGVLSADCAPILIADGEARIVAAVHAGWRGALSGVVEAAVGEMTRLGAMPGAMVAAIGPCIGRDSYEVGPEFLARFENGAPGSGSFFAAGRCDRLLFDLPGFLLSRLATAGVARREWMGRDTCAEEGDFFSNRRAVKKGERDYGRLLSAVMLSS